MDADPDADLWSTAQEFREEWAAHGVRIEAAALQAAARDAVLETAGDSELPGYRK